MMNDPPKQLENHPQYFRAQADCFEILPVIPDGSVDLVLTDPPYGCLKFDWDVKYADSVTFKNDAGIILKTVATVVRREGISSETSATMEEFMGSGDTTDQGER